MKKNPHGLTRDLLIDAMLDRLANKEKEANKAS